MIIRMSLQSQTTLPDTFSGLSSVAFSWGANRIVSGSTDGTLNLWDAVRRPDMGEGE